MGHHGTEPLKTKVAFFQQGKITEHGLATLVCMCGCARVRVCMGGGAYVGMWHASSHTPHTGVHWILSRQHQQRNEQRNLYYSCSPPLQLYITRTFPFISVINNPCQLSHAVSLLSLSHPQLDPLRASCALLQRVNHAHQPLSMLIMRSKRRSQSEPRPRGKMQSGLVLFGDQLSSRLKNNRHSSVLCIIFW